MNDRVNGWNISTHAATTVSCHKVILIAFRAQALWMRYSEVDSENLTFQQDFGDIYVNIVGCHRAMET
jgi:hypothetical protein